VGDGNEAARRINNAGQAHSATLLPPSRAVSHQLNPPQTPRDGAAAPGHSP
jgi:hypothetical protein